MNTKKAIKQFQEIKKLSGKMRLAAEGWDTEWKILLTTIMSARSLDETTIKVAEILYKEYNSLKKISEADITDIENIIRPINFYKNKSKNIIACSKILVERYNGKVPHDFEKLLELPGVGRKTANVFLSEIGKDEIGIDTHVDFITHYLGWTKKKKMIDVENDLKKLFPKKYWKEINPTLVKFGKKYTSRKEKNKVLDEINEIE